MKKRTFTLDDKQITKLQGLAKKLDLKASQLLRRILDEYFARNS